MRNEKVDMTISNLEEILGKFCLIYIKNSKQTILFQGKELSMSAAVEGLVIKITNDMIHLSDGQSDDVSKIIPRDSIAYIDVEPEDDNIKIMDFGGNPFEDDDGSRH